MDFLKLLKEEKKQSKQAQFPSISRNDSKSNCMGNLDVFGQLNESMVIIVNQQEKQLDLFNVSNEEFGVVHYVPNFIYEISEEELMQYLRMIKWNYLRTRQTAVFGTLPEVSKEPIVSYSIPPFLEDFISRMIEFKIFDASMRPNNILINRYSSTEGILHHTDGPSYHDHVAILSLGSDCIISFRKKLESHEIGDKFDGDLFSIVLRSCGLLYFHGDAYTKYMHGIAAEPSARQAVGDYGQSLNAVMLGLTSTDMVTAFTFFLSSSASKLALFELLSLVFT